MDGISTNVLPRIFADYLESKYGFLVFDQVFKTSSQHLTSMSVKERAKVYVEFDFDDDVNLRDIEGRQFVVLDDNITSGKTSMALARWLTDNGGIVRGFASLAKGNDSVTDVGITQESYEKLYNIAMERGIDENTIKRELSWITERQAREFAKNLSEWLSHLNKSGRSRDDSRGSNAGKKGSAEDTGRGTHGGRKGKISFSFSATETSLKEQDSQTEDAALQQQAFTPAPGADKSPMDNKRADDIELQHSQRRLQKL